MNLKEFLINADTKRTTSKQPTFKELMNLEKWAFKNNFYVHPEYIEATRTKNKIITVLSVLATFAAVFVLKAIVALILILTR
jgi:hypothetical protein